MDPIRRAVLTVVGALIGAGIAAPGARFIDAIIGALLGFGIAELSDLRSQQRKLDAQIQHLKARPAP